MLIIDVVLFCILFYFVGVLHGVFHIEETIEKTKNKKLSMLHIISEVALTAQGVLLVNDVLRVLFQN